MLTLREFGGDEYVNSCRKVYDESRYYLKNCGKPNDWYDKWLIQFHKFNCEINRRYVVEDRGY
jgi:hypothetical protein